MAATSELFRAALYLYVNQEVRCRGREASMSYDASLAWRAQILTCSSSWFDGTAATLLRAPWMLSSSSERNWICFLTPLCRLYSSRRSPRILGERLRIAQPQMHGRKVSRSIPLRCYLRLLLCWLLEITRNGRRCRAWPSLRSFSFSFFSLYLGR